LQLDIDLSII